MYQSLDSFRILQQRSKNMICWCEAFLMSAIQVNSLEVVTISPMEAARYNLVFPDQSLLSKIPAYLTPEELAPPLHWTQMSALNVCISSKQTRGFVESNRDVIGDLEFCLLFELRFHMLQLNVRYFKRTS